LNKGLRVACWNARGAMVGANYIDALLKSRCLDLLGISEHWLYPDSLTFLDKINSNYVSHGVADNSLHASVTNRRGKGGVAILWHTNLSPYVRTLDIEGDRIVGVCLSFQNSRPLFILQAYLPSSNHPAEFFAEYVDYLAGLYDFYRSVGDVIIMGDLNVKIEGPRTPKVSKCRRVRVFEAFLKEANLFSIPVSAYCKGPNFTFDPYEGSNKTLIDHICVNSIMLDTSSLSEVIDDEILNTSDHLPVFCVLKPYKCDPSCEVYSEGTNVIKRVRLHWKRCIQSDFLKIEHYRELLKDQLPQRNANNVVSTDEVDDYYDKVITAMTNAAVSSLPSCDFKKRLRPYWNDSLKYLHQSMRQTRRAWVLAGKPRNPDSVERTNYKNSKRIFRAEKRRLDEKLEETFYNEVNEAAEVDQVHFWKLLKSRNRSSDRPPPPMTFGDEVIYDTREISNKWSEYFANLYKPDTSGKYDEDFRRDIESKVQEMVEMSKDRHIPLLDNPFTYEEVATCLRNLKNGKATGIDGISNEHLKYGGHELHQSLTYMFNIFLSTEHIPKAAKRGLIHTLYKGGGKDRSVPGSYRPITLLPTVYKLFENLILERLKNWTVNSNIEFPNTQQSAYQRQRSCVSTSFVFEETVSHMLERHSKVYTCFLDAAKAFDTVWHHGLFFKLFRFGVQGKLWRVIMNCYHEPESCVVENGICSPWFSIYQGVRQGGVLSTWLYLLYIDELLKSLVELGVGAKLDDVECGSPCHADDLTLVTLAKYGLDEMMLCSFRYSIKWRYEYNSEKCIVMVFGETAQEWERLKDNRKWTLGPKPVNEAASHTHLGILQDKYRSSTKTAITAAQKLKKTLMSILGPGLQPHKFNPISSNRIYRTVCLPRALYGSELWCNLSQQNIKILERAHRFCLKRMQGFGRLTRTATVQAMIGSISLKGFLEKQCLLFFGQLTRMPENSLPRRIFELRYKSMIDRKAESDTCLGYIPYLVSVMDKHKLSKYVEEHMNSGNLSLPPGKRWKDVVSEKILESENCEFFAECERNGLQRVVNIEKSLDYPSLIWMAALSDPIRKYDYAFLAKLNTISANTETQCTRCTQIFTDQQVHFFCGCAGFASNRETFWERIENECPIELSAALWNMEDSDLTETLLGKQLAGFDFDANMHILKLAAESWRVW